MTNKIHLWELVILLGLIKSSYDLFNSRFSTWRLNQQQGGMLSMFLGRIKCFFLSKGYGYIEDGEGREVFFSLSAIEPGMDHRLVNGSEVYYQAITTGMGLEALRVSPARAF